MNRARQDHEMFIWTPLIGFDKEREDKGVADYYSTIGFQPDGISLFLFCPDIVHHHEGMERERILPPDNCNYYGNVRNEIRDIQQWTNFELKELVAGLEDRGAETYMGIMGVYVDNDPRHPSHYNTGHREWLSDHKELMGVWTNGTASLNVLKRFKDGTYYEDFFLAKLQQALKDYGFSGLHVADNFCPPGSGGSAKNGDYSDDMIDQFTAYTGISLPEEICAPVDDRDRDGIKKRGTYIWNRYKQEWLEFLTWRWAAFWEKICRGLHEDGKKVIVNNAWCSEPFEAIYRYGIDYKKLYEAGVDYIAAESVATSVHMAREIGPFRLYNYMTMPSFMKAYVPEGKLICLNGVKDSTEEWSTVGHFASSVEREIYSLTHYFVHTRDGLRRSMDGFLVCLGDGLTREEWDWLRERWEIGFAELPQNVLTPTFIWSDHAFHKLLPDYIATKRWSMHKTIYEFAKAGGQIGAVARIEELDIVSGPIFIPNIDLMSEAEIETISTYDRGPIICTSLADRRFRMPGSLVPDISFQDPLADFKMNIFGYRMDYIDYADITASLGEDDGSPDVAGEPRYAEDPGIWRMDLVYRKASTGFVKACGKLLRSAYASKLTADIEHPLLPMRMGDGRIRLLIGNDNRLQYRLPVVRTKRAVKRVVSKSKFPALPSKLVDTEGRTIIPRSDGSHESIRSGGFIAKIPPGGMTIFDVTLDDA
ncbi:hypothetical protein FE783_17110 [Paenibacillus mesophilus]|uniref:hypothetical protein n=1 Tax=Paenibacillus mesophilus TaxID=2582849 RepID=UPI00110F4E2F|nr:hypothetical protein [Paenibacillus mesophilus]TMV48764.1 hypothetical protein FE783_17110 [Paenibacillus mesophilus]